MKLVTEANIKKIIKNGNAVQDGELRLSAECLLTPAAQAVLVDHRLKLNQTAKPLKRRPEMRPEIVSAAATDVPASTKARYQVRGGGFLDEKPEHLTQLSGNLLVPKDDLRIHLRGTVDLLIAEILKTQIRVLALGCQRLVDDLEDVYGFVGQLSRSEVLDQPFQVSTVIGLDYSEIREISHNPNRFFGRGHLFDISYRDGELAVLLNALRAASRDCELAFYEAFKTTDGTVERVDLMAGYNRLSSLFYILCLRAATGEYEVKI